MKRLIIGLMLVTLLLVTAACAAPPTPEPMPAPSPAPAPSPEIVVPAPAPAPAPAQAPPPAEGRDGGVVAPAELGQTWATERMIVRTGNMQLVVTDVSGALDQITELTEAFGGYVVNSKRWGEDDRLSGYITIRVPAEDFDNVTRELRKLAVEVTSEETSSKDVTEEYVDLTAKLGNLEATEAQLLRLMEKAETVEDILNVQRELSQTRGEIEQTKGRIQYLERTSSTSLIEIYLQQAELGVNFTASKRTVKEGEKVRFIGEIAGGFPPHSFEWDFGDGETSTSDYPTHSYKKPGSYTVSLKVTDDQGNTNSKTRDNYIDVLPGWNAGSIVSSAWKGLVIFGQVLANIFIWVGIFSPVWIVIGGIIYWRLRRRKKKA